MSALLLSTLIVFLALTASAVSAQPFELSFWPSENAKGDPRVVRLESHPCGEVAVARVTAIPPFKKGAALTPELVLETSPTGKVIRRWWLPTDSSIRAIRGDTLTIQYYSKLYTVRPGGRISELALAEFSDEVQRSRCKVPPELLPSDYATCEVFNDTKTNLPRRLAYEGICS
jgi:hypothetical protein